MTDLFEFDADLAPKTLKAFFPVRFPSDSMVNGVADSDENPTMPLLSKEITVDKYWEYRAMNIEIDVPTGKVKDWEMGVVATLNIKVVDAGVYSLFNGEGRRIAHIENDYAPETFEIDGNGYGDYIIITIQADGIIKGWKANRVLCMLKAKR